MSNVLDHFELKRIFKQECINRKLTPTQLFEALIDVADENGVDTDAIIEDRIPEIDEYDIKEFIKNIGYDDKTSDELDESIDLLNELETEIDRRRSKLEDKYEE